MPATAFRRTPGVYVTELSAFPPSVVGIQTAVPAFIGYTEKAEVSGKPVLGKAIKIGSLADYQAIFGAGFRPEYKITEVTEAAEINNGQYDFQVADPTSGTPVLKYYRLEKVSASEFNLYNSLRLFYANGGGTAYIVSVGTYRDKATGSLNPITETGLIAGLDVIKEQVGPTMLVVPDAVLLPNDGVTHPKWQSAAFKNVAQAMLRQSAELKDRVSILDVYGSQYTTKDDLEKIIAHFRTDVGEVGLSYGMSYFPFLETTVVPITEITYKNIETGTATTRLKEVLGWQREDLYGPATGDEATARAIAVQADIDAIPTAPDVNKLNQNLTTSLPLMLDIERVILAKNQMLPPSGAMAGVVTYVDATRGVWNAPANLTLSSVVRPTYKLSGEEQGDLNVPVDGKAVDAIREFTGRGTVVWGARTLDGNSNDYRYIQVRRTLIYIEQSIKAALDPFVFAANDGNTWTTVVSMLSNFLQGLWSQGGLMGATASEAFSVECGIGSTMTGQDSLDGYMVVQVTLQMIRPAEFIELTFKQKMEGVGG
ncbi:MAG: phage tail sheath C-terminal domain-containing protein [Thermoanaerobaculia bacterium]|nr:phage tail sheath C-terminal domain-containing protein [Thermoanaerobaculia bacterium]